MIRPGEAEEGLPKVTLSQQRKCTKAVKSLAFCSSNERFGVEELWGGGAEVPDSPETTAEKPERREQFGKPQVV